MDVGGIEFKRFGELSAPCKPPYSCRSENGKGEIVKQGGLQADEQNVDLPAITRRSVLEGAAAAVAMLGLGGAVRAFAGEGTPLRPPGGQDEARLQGSCIRCDRCRTVCPTKAIGVGALADGVVNVRLPQMDFRSGYCDMCDGEFRCVRACPTGALMSFDPFADKIGVAVVDVEECQLYGVSATCNAPCVDACEYKALSIDENGRLVVDESRCNGCGACEFVCPTSAYRTYSGSGKRGINIEAKEASNV